jgi:hypothetical protein
MQTNKKDPLPKVGPEAQRELFQQFKQSASGFQQDDVVGAAVNVLVNALRQTHGSRKEAEKAFDELMGRTKGLLLDGHYDATTGKRLNIFPFHQVIEMPLMSIRQLKTFGKD